MSLRGTIRNGKIELDTNPGLPEGTRVDVEPSKPESLLDIFRRHAIHDPSLPKDYASELDHYLYGLPKRNGKLGRKSALAKPSKKTGRKTSKRKRGRAK